MANKNSSNQIVNKNADGWDSSYGVIPRKMTVTGGDVTMTGGSSSYSHTMPNQTDTLVGTTASQTLTNKRIPTRNYVTTTATSLTPDLSAYDTYELNALASALTINAPVGSPIDKETIAFSFKDNGTARGLTWNAVFVSITGSALPTTTTISKWMYIFCVYNSTAAKWHVTGVAQEA